MTPVVVGACRGWLHRPPTGGPVHDNLVLVPAHGVEDLATRASLARLAHGLAASGHTVLRLDLPGSGDALGDWTQPGLLAAGVDAVVQAVDAVRQWTGHPPTALMGLRLGTLVATRAAQALAAAGRPVSGLALLAPVVQGRQHVRELQALHTGDGPVAVAGFAFSPDTLADLSAQDLGQPPTPCPAPRVFLGVPGTPRGLNALVAQWQATAVLTSEPYPGLAEHIGDPTQSVAPQALFERLGQWLAEGSAPAPLPTPASRPERPAPAVLHGPGFAETGDVLPVATGLAAVWCDPAAPAGPAAGPVVVVCNAGRNPHTGWARGSVQLARALAGQGLPSLRFDLAGLGDSPPLPDAPAETLYHPVNFPQLRAVLDQVVLRHPARPVVVVGACSGGHLAFHEAVDDDRVRGLVLVNVQRFIWVEGMSLQAEMRSAGKSTQAYRQKLFQADTWRRLLRGGVDVKYVATALLRRLWKKVHSRLQPPDPGPRRIRDGFAALAQRGTHTLVLYSQDDGGRDDFARCVGADTTAFTRLAHTRQVLLPDADHDLTADWAQARLRQEVLDLCRSLGQNPAP
jgi:alpha-beta hydrolase superfamily lysophospholipase